MTVKLCKGIVIVLELTPGRVRVGQECVAFAQQICAGVFQVMVLIIWEERFRVGNQVLKALGILADVRVACDEDPW